MKKDNVIKNKPLNPKPSRKLGLEADSFFLYDKHSKRRRKLDEEIQSDEEEAQEDQDASESEEETVAEKKLRLIKEFVQKQKRQAERFLEEQGESADEGRLHSIVAEMLHKEQLEDSGRVRRLIASRVQKPETSDGFRLLLRQRQSVTAVALAEDDMKGFSASKDGTIVQWDVEKGKSEKYVWPNEEVMSSHGAKKPEKPSSKWSRHILDIAVSSDGRYLATGGFDRHVHIWDSRTRQHIRALRGHKGPVSCLTFRQGTSELFSGSFDGTINSWNAEDRSYVHEQQGHQAEVLSIDCLRKERVLSVGRDRTLRFWKSPLSWLDLVSVQKNIIIQG